jgi:hypothetical protein
MSWNVSQILESLKSVLVGEVDTKKLNKKKKEKRERERERDRRQKYALFASLNIEYEFYSVFDCIACQTIHWVHEQLVRKILQICVFVY